MEGVAGLVHVLAYGAGEHVLQGGVLVFHVRSQVVFVGEHLEAHRARGGALP